MGRKRERREQRDRRGKCAAEVRGWSRLRRGKKKRRQRRIAEGRGEKNRGGG